jgi:hypothetical protein
VIAAILIRPPASIVERNAAIPPRLEEIVGRALEKDRELRYQHAGDLLADLKRLRRDLDINPSLSSFSRAQLPSLSPTLVATRIAPAPLPEALPASNPSVAPASQAASPPVWRHGVAGGAGAAFVVIALALGWVWRPWDRPTPSAPPSTAAPAQVTPATSPTAPLPSPSVPSQPEAATPPSPAPASPGAAPTTSPTRSASQARSQPAAGSLPTPSTTRGAQVAAPPASTAAAPPPPQATPAAPGPLLSGVPLANESVAAPPPSAPAARSAPPTTPGRATSPETSAPPAAVESDEAAIRRTLATYATAVEKKDVTLFRSVKPGLSAAEEGRLRESFKQIDSQQVTLDIEDLRVDGRAATARVARTDNLVVGGRRQTQSSRQVVRLEKTAAGWVITEFR